MEFDYEPKNNQFSKLNFSRSQLKSPIGSGLFDIFINTQENIVYKKIRRRINDPVKYKKIIYGLKNNAILREYIFEPEKIYIENDGSYYSSFVKNGLRLYDIHSKSKIDNKLLNNLQKSIIDLKSKLNNYVKTNKLNGDWALHNLIYCIDTNKIYNVDLEGFYTYPIIHDNGNCDIKYCNERFDNLLGIINKLNSNKITVNDEYFTLILWNPTLFQSEKILHEIPNIIEKKEIVIPKESLYNYIFDIYKLDTRCSHNIVLPPKIQKLKEYNDNHLVVKFKIDKPQYTNNICNQAVQLKEMIREKYKSYIKNYIKDIMIHVADNFEQSKYIWEKKIIIWNNLKLFVQKATNPLRYKLSKIDKYGKDGWNTINVMNVYENYIQGTKEFFLYRAANPRRYCLSDEKIKNNNWEYCYNFYCHENDIDKRITLYKTISKTKIPTNWKKLGGYSHVNNNKVFFDLLLISQHFDFKRNGFFIEIGANNGIIQSNTYMLEKHYNWKGLLVEPSIFGYNNCKKIRNNSIVINSCVGNEDDKKQKFVHGDFNGNCMSSINGNRLNNKTNLIKCPITTLETILDEHQITNIDFFSLDVEGYEYQVLEGLNLKKYKPKYLLIEVYLNDKDKIESLLYNNNYKFVTNLSNYNRKDNPKWKGQHQDLLYKLSNNIIDYSQKYITGDNFKIICDFYINNNQLIATNNNIQQPFYGCFIFIKCSYLKTFFRYIFNSIKYPFYIVTHNSDVSSPSEYYNYLNNNKIIKWYCKNNDYDKYHHKLELIPLGLGNTRDKNILHQIHEKKKSFEDKKFPYKCLISSNFTTYNKKTHSRSVCYNNLKNNDLIEIMSQRLDYREYLEYILDYGFIISPHGNGLDCTRTWESILLGLIPIVKKSTLDRLYTNLPVMIVNDWNEITLDKLKRFKDNCNIKETYDLLYTDFWENKFKKDRMYINIRPLQLIFDKLTNYVVLRGYDDLHKKIPLLKNSDDIDILVTEKNDIVKLCGNNIVVINNERVKFDRRYIGDNYYDSKWQKNMIATKVKRHFFYILDESNNYYATLYHSLIHKGKIHNKYEKLYKTFENKHKLNSDIISRYYQLLKFMFKNKYTFPRAIDSGVGFFKNKYKLNLFIIRKKGMEREVIENILNHIKKEYQIVDKVLINIYNKKKFYSNFYENYDEHKDDIEKTNDNQCLAIVTNNPDNKNPNKLKENIRKQYIKFYPPLGNIIHCSDSAFDCEKELGLLFNENIDNFKNIGTYYSQKDV